MQSFDKLKEWLNVNNDNIYMFEKGSRGLYSKKNIKENEIIMRIPSKYIIHYSKVKNKYISDKICNINSLMASYLYVKSLKNESFWTPYLKSMPQSCDEYIYYYDKKKLSLLNNTSIMCKDTYNFKIHMKNIVNDCKIIHKWLLEKDLLHEDHKKYNNFYPIFLKYRILVCSRIFGYDKNGEKESGLVPYADLLNHSEEPNTTWYFNDKNNCFEVMATKNIDAGCEIYDSYGNKNNIELIMYYGFSTKNNKFSKLNFIYDGNLFVADYESTIDTLINQSTLKKNKKSELIIKLKSILTNHESKIKNISDQNIVNIYNDDISIIQNILKEIKS